jgi:hypothetical protein
MKGMTGERERARSAVGAACASEDLSARLVKLRSAVPPL